MADKDDYALNQLLKSINGTEESFGFRVHLTSGTSFTGRLVAPHKFLELVGNGVDGWTRQDADSTWGGAIHLVDIEGSDDQTLRIALADVSAWTLTSS